MARFSSAQLGDKVYSLIFGEGKIVSVFDHKVVCEFNIRDQIVHYDFYIDGRFIKHTGEPTLFYLDGNANRCEERPLSVPSIDGRYLPKDILVCIVKDRFNYVKRYFAYKNILDRSCISVYSNGATSSTWESVDVYYLDEIVVVTCEEIVINGITYPVGTRIL